MPQGQHQQPQSQCIPQGQYQPQGQYVQSPSGQLLQGNIPVNYQPYVQTGYGPQYVQPSMSQIPGIVWDPSQVQQILQQPNVQLPNPNQPGPSIIPIQSTPQVFALGSI